MTTTTHGDHLEAVEEHIGIPWTVDTPFEKWIGDLGLPMDGGYFAGPLSAPDLEMTWWPRKGVSARFFDLVGAESAGAMYVARLEAGASTEAVHQLFEETIYVVSGRGSLVISDGERSREMEWGPGSLFAIPMNATHRLHCDQSGPARFISVNTLPLMFNLLRDEEFIFGADWDPGRLEAARDPSSAVLYHPDAAHDRTAVDLYDVALVPDVKAVPRSPFVERADGASCVYFEMANSALSAHVLGISGGHFFRPHRHGPAGFVFPIQGSGYSLMWAEGEEPIRFDWPTDEPSLIVPPSGWWHGHFVTSPVGLHLAVKLMSRKFPVNHLYDGVHKTLDQGGTVLRYEDLDAELGQTVWATYRAECERNGLEVVDPSAARTASREG